MTHDFDAVLNLYYAKARFYDADNRRFTAVDPILDPSRYDLREYVTDPMQLVQYLYVKNNAVNWIDLLGLIGTVSQLYVNGNKYDNVAILYDDSTWIKTSSLESILKAAEITGGKSDMNPLLMWSPAQLQSQIVHIQSRNEDITSAETLECISQSWTGSVTFSCAI